VDGERNLAPERGPNLWARHEYGVPPSSQSRWRGGLGGVAVAAAGAALAGVGGLMLYRSLRRRGRTAPPAHHDEVTGWRDQVEDQSSDSFPASDSPSWTPVRSVQPRGQRE